MVAILMAVLLSAFNAHAKVSSVDKITTERFRCIAAATTDSQKAKCDELALDATDVAIDKAYDKLLSKVPNVNKKGGPNWIELRLKYDGQERTFSDRAQSACSRMVDLSQSADAIMTKINLCKLGLKLNHLAVLVNLKK